MNAPLEFRNQMLAATMLNRWQTLSEVIERVRINTRHKFSRVEAMEHLAALGLDPNHRLESRRRAGCREKEWRLYVEARAVTFARWQRPFHLKRGNREQAA